MWLNEAPAAHHDRDLDSDPLSLPPVSNDSLLSLLGGDQLDFPTDQPGDADQHERIINLFQALSSRKGPRGAAVQQLLAGREYSGVQYTGDASAAVVVVAFPDAACSLLECIQ